MELGCLINSLPQHESINISVCYLYVFVGLKEFSLSVRLNTN